MFATAVYFNPSLIFEDKARAYLCKPPYDGNSRLLALPENVTLGWKMAVSNTLAYFNTATIASVKSFVVQDPGGLAGLACSYTN